MPGDDTPHPGPPGHTTTTHAPPASTEAPGPLPTTDAHALAELLSPALHDACDGRLGQIEWFHATWQRGGACTGFSTFRLRDDAPPVEVMVKMPVGPAELWWTHGLGACDASSFIQPTALTRVTPRVLAAGPTLAGHRVPWLVLEKLAGPHMPKHMDAGEVTELIGATLDFHAATQALAPLAPKPPSPNFEALIERSRETCKNHVISGEQHWNEMLKKVQRALPALRGYWERRPINTWCHGDLHPGNAMRRVVTAGGADPGALALKSPLVLIDLALVHPGHWMEDALYLERQYWGNADLLHGIKPVSLLARLRRERGLPVDDYAHAANARRILMAACAPAMIEREGNPKYVGAAIEIIERLLPQVPH
ncbi:MAG: phosphotransferase [Phycisphaerales bacterium]